MSKGSKQRPGTGYADNWDRIFGNKAKSEQAPDEMVVIAQDAALDAAFRRYGTYPGKVWYKQPDGSLIPADGGAPLEVKA